MGFLSDGAPEGMEQNAEPAADPEAPTTEGQQQEAQTEEPQRTERVTLTRRDKERAKRDELSTQLKTLSETVSKSEQNYREELSKRDAEIARLAGFQQAALLHQQQRQAPVQAAPDPVSLMKEAKKALDAGDLDGYHDAIQAAMEARIMGKIPAPQPQYQPQQQANPVAMALLTQNPAVLAAGQRGINLAIIEDQKLALMGIPDGPDRWKKSFALAENALQPAPQPGYSADSRQVLSGVGTRPTGGGSREAGVTLSDFELKWAEASGMSKEEYAKALAEANPKRLER